MCLSSICVQCSTHQLHCKALNHLVPIVHTLDMSYRQKNQSRYSCWDLLIQEAKASLLGNRKVMSADMLIKIRPLYGLIYKTMHMGVLLHVIHCHICCPGAGDMLATCQQYSCVFWHHMLGCLESQDHDAQ